MTSNIEQGICLYTTVFGILKMSLAISGSRCPDSLLLNLHQTGTVYLATHFRAARSFLTLRKCSCHACFKLWHHNLERYLPKGAFIPSAGLHLNIALPLCQGFSTQSGEVVTRQIFMDAIHSSDAVREWAASWRNSHNSLGYSSNPLLRGYWAR